MSQLIVSLGLHNRQGIDSWLQVATRHTQRGEEDPNIVHECRLIFGSSERLQREIAILLENGTSINYKNFLCLKEQKHSQISTYLVCQFYI